MNARIKLKTDTTANWNAASTFIPLKGEMIVYSDYSSKTVNGKTVVIPNFKIGDGLAYCIDLPFVDEDLRIQMQEHFLNSQIHITNTERNFWNNKLNCAEDIEGETLIFTRL